MGISLGLLLFFCVVLMFFFLHLGATHAFVHLRSFLQKAERGEQKKVYDDEEAKNETIFASFASGYYCSFFFVISRPTQQRNNGNCEENIFVRCIS